MWNLKNNTNHLQKQDHKAGLGKFKKVEIISSIFSNHNTMRVEINYKEK